MALPDRGASIPFQFTILFRIDFSRKKVILFAPKFMRELPVAVVTRPPKGSECIDRD
jgi:hypothetical protein